MDLRHFQWATFRKPIVCLLLVLTLSIPIVSCRGSDSGSSEIQQNCEYRENLDETATSFIGRCCLAKIRQRFPGEYFGSTLQEIQDARAIDRNADRAYKLLNDGRFRK